MPNQLTFCTNWQCILGCPKHDWKFPDPLFTWSIQDYIIREPTSTFLAGFNCFLIRLSPLNRYREKPHKKIPCLDLRPLLLSCLLGQFYNPHFLSCSIFLLGIRCCCSPIHWYHYQRLSTNKELKIWARDNVINSILKGKIIGNSRSNDTDQNLRRRALEISPFKSLKLAPIEQTEFPRIKFLLLLQIWWTVMLIETLEVMGQRRFLGVIEFTSDCMTRRVSLWHCKFL